jgi:hypothetical protein
MALDRNDAPKSNEPRAAQLTSKGIVDGVINLGAALLIITFISLTFYQCAGSPQF